MKNRFYIREEDSHNGEFNYVVTPEGKEIEYSYMCTRSQDNPPEDRGYRLVYQTDKDNYEIIVDPFGMRDMLNDSDGDYWDDGCPLEN